MERSGAQKHQVSHSQLPTWPRKKIFLFLLKVKLALTDGGAGAQPGPWHWGVNLFLLPRTFPSNPANPCNISYATLTHQPQQELTVMSQLKPVKVYGNTQLTLLPKRENFDILLKGCPNKVMVEGPTISMEDPKCLLLTSHMFPCVLGCLPNFPK